MRLILSFAILLVAFLSFASASQAGHKRTPMRLQVESPKARHAHVTVKQGVKTFKYHYGEAIFDTRLWPLTLRASARKWVANIERRQGDVRRRALVLKDPDNCLHLGPLVDVPPNVSPPFEAGCDKFDELFIEVGVEKFDTREVEDQPSNGNNVIQERLFNDAYTGGMLLNTPYLRFDDGKIKQVGPQTEQKFAPDPNMPDVMVALRDGYGFGTDDDFVSLVIMADIGGARVFDEDFNHVPGVIRNLAGFINTVSLEHFDGRRRIAYTASAHVLAGLFEPIVVVDLDVADPAVDFLTRVDSSEPMAFNFDGPVPTGNALTEAILSTYAPYRVRIRAVVVEGEAPPFIEDRDGDGQYTALDLQHQHKLVSNQIEVEFDLTFELLFGEFANECTPRNLVYIDLDVNGKNGDPKCGGTGGARRVSRVPR